MIKEFCFPGVTNFVEICKRLSSLNFNNVKLKSKQIFKWKLRLRLHGILQQFCMEPFRAGTDRLSVYTIFWNRFVQNCSFQSIHAWAVPNDSLSLLSSGTWKILKKLFPAYICSSKPYTKFSLRATFPVIVSYPQSDFLWPRFLAYLTRTVMGVYTRNFWFGSVLDLLSRWTSSGTASGSVWNSSIISRVNVRPIRTVLARFHMEP